MNVFVLDLDPAQAAEYHADKHVVKMILETAQLLSAAHHVLDGEEAIGGIYKKTHANHPCAVWARASSSNYRWLLELGYALLGEYSRRYQGREHKTGAVLDLLRALPRRLPQGHLTPFAQAMPSQYQHPDPVMAYRAYYQAEKRSIATWKLSTPPWWGAEETE